MKSQYTAVLIPGLLLIAISVIFFVLPGEIKNHHIIIYGLTFCAYLCAMLSYYMIFSKVQASIFLQTPLVLAISSLLLIQTAYLFVIRICNGLQAWIYTVGETIILAFFLIIIISLMSSQSYISRNKKTVSGMTAFINNLKIELFTYASTIDDSTSKKIVDDLISIVKYSDPVSCHETKQIEEEIKQCFQDIKEGGGDINNKVGKMKQLLSVRNKICQTYK